MSFITWIDAEGKKHKLHGDVHSLKAVLEAIMFFDGFKDVLLVIVPMNLVKGNF